MIAGPGLWLLECGPVEAWRYLLGGHRYSGSSLSSKRHRDIKVVAESSLGRHRFGINNKAIAFFHSLDEEIVSFRRTGEHPRNLRPEFSISRPAQPLRRPSAPFCVAGKGSNPAQAKMPMSPSVGSPRSVERRSSAPGFNFVVLKPSGKGASSHGMPQKVAPSTRRLWQKSVLPQAGFRCAQGFNGKQPGQSRRVGR